MRPYLYLAGVLLWLASVAGVGYWQRHDGESVANLAWQTRETAQQAQAAQRIKQLEEEARAAEDRYNQNLADISAQYEKGMQDAKDQYDRDTAAIRDGSLRLRDYHTACVPTGRGAPGKTGATAGRRDEPGVPELSAETTRRLFSLADDAARVSRKLAACQQIVLEDRKTCNGE